MMLAIILALLVIFISLEAFFSGTEIVFISANRAKVLQKAKENDPRAVIAKKLLSKPENLFATTVVGTILCMCSSTALSGYFFLKRYGSAGEWINLLVLTPVILVLGEFVPKMIGRYYADKLILELSGPLSIASYILSPFTTLLTAYISVVNTLFGSSGVKSFLLSREEIKAALPASRGSDVTPAERDLIARILEFGKITVGEMLRPLIDVIAIDENSTVAEALALFSESEHSRLPVYQERVDTIVGILHSNDCLRAADHTLLVTELMKPAFFVPLSKPVDELFHELKTRTMAVVVNEFGGADGIVTMEDVMEEVVGEIEDEYDEPERLFHKIGEQSYIVNARMEIYDIKELLNINIPPDDDYQTLAGFLLKRMQKIPKKWDSTIIDGVEYVVQSATDRSIEEVYVIIHPKK